MDTPKYGTEEYDQYVADERKRIEEIHGTVYNTNELTAKFDIEGFGAPFCFGTVRETGKKATLEFQHSPRFYWE